MTSEVGGDGQMVALVIFTRRRAVMGEFANGRLTNIVATAGMAAILALNVVLLLQTFGGDMPGFSGG